MSDKANWTELNADDLPAAIAGEYQKYKDMYRAMKAQRERFETALAAAADVPAGKRMIFGYNFGKLSVAIVDDDRKPAKSAQPKLSLAEFMRQQAASGHRC
jgi:hypothetical protein